MNLGLGRKIELHISRRSRDTFAFLKPRSQVLISLKTVRGAARLLLILTMVQLKFE
jgi:hypothetical protein